MKEQLTNQLRQIAIHITMPFCYGCYVEAPKGRCTKCGSDDLMILYPGSGCEYGIDWVLHELVREIPAESINDRFENFMREIYPEETKIGFLTYDTVSAMKELDPVAWDLAQSEWVDSEEGEENLISFDSETTHFSVSEVESFISQKESELGLRSDEE